ncbi:MAG: hypothetical protein ACFCBW_14780 [Candidatus Competibacterales bacterium]
MWGFHAILKSYALENQNRKLSLRLTEVNEELATYRTEAVQLRQNLQLLAGERVATLKALRVDKILSLDGELAKSIAFSRRNLDSRLDRYEFRLVVVNPFEEVRAVGFEVALFNHYGIKVGTVQVGSLRSKDTLAPREARAFVDHVEVDRLETPRYFAVRRRNI